MTYKLPRMKVLILTLLMAFMELSALPAAFLGQVTFKDIKPMYFTLMLNFIIALITSLVAYVLLGVYGLLLLKKKK